MRCYPRSSRRYVWKRLPWEQVNRLGDEPLGGTVLTPESGSILMYVCFGLGVLLIGAGIFILCLRAGTLLTRFGKTLDGVDRQIDTLSAPVATTLTHVGGIADTADSTLARLAAVVGQLENVATGATKTANLIGVTISGVQSAMKPKTGAPAEDEKET